MALAGARWYNNDGDTVFGEVLVGTGYPASPGDLAGFLGVASGVQGGSSGMASVDFVAPVVASQDALYVAFAFPAAEQLTALGLGGGPGVGYGAHHDGVAGWIGGEDGVWARLHEDLGFIVEPILVEAAPEMAVKSLDDDAPDAALTEPYLAVGPNPFNPATRIEFGLVASARVDLAVYDLRGRHVCTLIADGLDAGVHRVRWDGRDGRGRAMASGIYVFRLRAGAIRLTKAVTLVR